MAAIFIRHFSFGADNLQSALHKDVGNVDRLIEQSATVAPQVDDHPFQIVGLLKFQESLAHLFGGILGESRKFHISDLFVKHPGVRDVVNFNDLSVY